MNHVTWDCLWTPEGYNPSAFHFDESAKVVIAGSREITDYDFASRAISVGLTTLGIGKISWIGKIISGHARGVDLLGERYAREHKIPVELFKPDWERFGKAAGVIRNKDMARAATHAIILRKNKSRGSTHMANFCKQLSVPFYLLDVEKWYNSLRLPFN